MIAIGILSTWLILTGASFKGLSALTRIGVSEEVQANDSLADGEALPRRRRIAPAASTALATSRALLR